MSSQRPQALPPLRSPRGHLLARIRSTPRSAKFVPQAAPATAGTSTRSAPADNKVCETMPQSTYATPPRSQAKRHVHTSSWDQKHDLARQDQMALLEQPLRAQNGLLAQQQALLQQLQSNADHQGRGPLASHISSPPYTPQSHYQQYNNMICDPRTGQYYAITPANSSAMGSNLHADAPEFSYSVTPPQRPAHLLKADTAGFPNSITSRSSTPPKEGMPSRQPKGPPAMELLVADKDGALNFSSRSRKRATKVLEAGLLRRRCSPTLLEGAVSSSCASSRSNVLLGPIEESFPLISISRDGE